MTISELLNLPTQELQSLTDEQLQSHLVKFFPFTRPKNSFNAEDFAAGDDKDKIKSIMAALAEKDKARPRLILPK